MIGAAGAFVHLISGVNLVWVEFGGIFSFSAVLFFIGTRKPSRYDQLLGSARHWESRSNVVEQMLEREREEKKSLINHLIENSDTGNKLLPLPISVSAMTSSGLLTLKERIELIQLRKFHSAVTKAQKDCPAPSEDPAAVLVDLERMSERLIFMQSEIEGAIGLLNMPSEHFDAALVALSERDATEATGDVATQAEAEQAVAFAAGPQVVKEFAPSDLRFQPPADYLSREVAATAGCGAAPIPVPQPFETEEEA